MTRRVAMVLVFSAPLFAAAVVMAPDSLLAQILAIGVVSGCVRQLTVRRGALVAIPVAVVAGGAALVGTFGFHWYGAVSSADAAVVHRRLSTVDPAETLTVFLVFAVTFSLTYWRCLKPAISVRGSAPQVARADLAAAIALADRYRFIGLFFAFLNVSSLVVGAGPGVLVRRAEYLHGVEWAVPVLFRFGSQTSMLSVVVLASISTMSQSIGARWVSRALLGLQGLVNFAFASRELAVTVVLIWLAGLALTVDRASRRELVLRFAAVAILAVLLVSLALNLRKLDDHGLVPYAAHVANDTGSAFGFQVEELGANVLNSFPLAGHIALEHDRNINDLKAHLAPPYSPWTDLYDARFYEYFVTPWTPESGIGTLSSVGLLAVGLYAAISGLAFARVVSPSASPTNSPLVAQIRLGSRMAGVGLSVFFFLMLLQYHLRMSCWVLFFAVGILAVRFIAESRVRVGPKFGTTQHFVHFVQKSVVNAQR